MAMHMHLQNLSMLATNLDVHHFFMHYHIPAGGVQILGGPAGDAFITFGKVDDLLSALSLSGQNLLGQPVTLRIISKKDMEQLFDKRKSEFMSTTQRARSMPSSHGEANQSTQQEDVNTYTDHRHFSSQSYEGDWKQTKEAESIRNIGEATGSDYYLKDMVQDPSYRIGRDHEQIKMERSSDRWDSVQYRIPIEQKGIDEREKRRQDSYSAYYNEVPQHQLGHEKPDMVSENKFSDSNFGTIPLAQFSYEKPVILEARYIRIHNLPGSLSHGGLRAIVHSHNIDFRDIHDIIIMDDSRRQRSSALIACANYHIALRIKALDKKIVEGKVLKVEIISNDTYEMQKERWDMVQANLSERGFQEKAQPVQRAVATQHGYLRIQNIPATIRKKDLLAFLQRYNMPVLKSAVYMRLDNASQTYFAYVRVIDDQVARRAALFRNCKLDGQLIRIEKISSHKYNEELTRLRQQNDDAIQKELPTEKVGVKHNQYLSNVDRNKAGYQFEWFIKFDQLADDATACEVWDWFGGAHGSSKGVYLVRHDSVIFCYVVFGSAQSRNAAMAVNMPCRAVSPNQAYRHLAGLGPLCHIFQATKMGKDREMTEKQKAALKLKITASTAATDRNYSSIFADIDERVNAEPGSHKFLCFMRVSNLAADATAWKIWKQYGGANGNCNGVVVVRKKNGNELNTMFAYIAFGNHVHRAAALKAAGEKRKWNIKATYSQLAQVEPHCSIFECTKPGKDREVSANERALLQQKFCVQKHKESTPVKLGQASNHVEKMKAEPSTKQANEQSIFSRLIIGAEVPGTQKLSFIHFLSGAIPEDATASGMSRWLGGPDKTSRGGILVRTAEGIAECAFIAFDNKVQCKAALEECEGVWMRTAASTRRVIVMSCSGCEVFESTETGEDRKVSEEQVKRLQQLTPLETKDPHAQGSKRKGQDLEETEAKKIKVPDGVQKQEFKQTANVPAVHKNDGSAKPEGMNRRQRRAMKREMLGI